MPETDPRKPQLLKLAAYLKEQGLEKDPFTVGSNYMNDKGNFPGGLEAHMEYMFNTITKLAAALRLDVPPLSIAIVAIGHVVHKVTDGRGHKYYVPKVLKSGKVSATPWETNDAWPELPAPMLNLEMIKTFYGMLTVEEVQALGVLGDNRPFDGLQFYPLTILAQAAYQLGIWHLEEHREASV